VVRRAQGVLGLAALVAAALAATSAGQTPATTALRPNTSSPIFTKAIAVQKNQAAAWRIAPGIVGTGVGVTPAGRPVIEVFTTRQGVALPETLGGIRVQPVVTGMIVARSATLRYPRPVPIGVSTGLVDFGTGTLGARVSNGSNVYALSNNHVFAGINMANVGDAILQPGPIEDGGTDPADRIGTLADFQEIDFNGGPNVMDAAIALTTPADVGTSTLPDGYGTPSTTTTTASIGLPVQKYGRTTGFTQGTVNAVNVDVDVCYFPITETLCFPGFEAHFVNQFSTPDGSVKFSDSGDSGSLIVAQGTNEPVGLLFAGGEGLTIGNPIGPVLQRFGVTIDGAPAGPGPPGAPTGLNAIAGDGQVALSWTAPSFDGGSSISNYVVYRGTAPNPTSALTTVPSTPTGYVDQSAVNGTTYYYKVAAVNSGSGEGAKSNEANATPITAVAPTALGAPLDDFNRANEILSDAGRWTNSIIAGESGFNVSSNQLACSVATTCTAWRNNQQVGPEAEVWARLTTLPGLNNHFRLYARLQMPGASAGYMLRTNQLSGIDEVYLDRFNGGGTRLLTIAEELAAGDTILMRVKGTSIEAWRLPSGGSWSRLGVVQDATYPAAAYVGVGLRGTTGRVDDFGARTIGVTPPDTTPPTDPSALSALAVSSSRIDLSWTASQDAGGVSLYRIERCTGPSCGNFVEIATLPGNQTTFQNTSLAPQTSYTYRVRAEDTATPPNVSGYSNLSSATTEGPPKPFYFSLLSDGTVGGVSIANEDVVSYDGATFTVAFDGSDVALASRRLDAFGWLDADSLVFSLDSDGATLPGVAGTIDDSDVIRFDATSLGTTTSGTFSIYFDGSDVGLTTSGEDVDAFELLANGTIVLSTDGSASVGAGVSAAAEDLLVFTPSSLGETTSGTFAMYFDGSDVGISTSNENVDAAAVDATGRVYLSTTGNFNAPGVSGADEDVFVFTPTTLGASTSGTFDSTLYFDGSAFGLGGNDITAIDLPPGA
jgi:Fibronectin type III domain